MCLWGGFCCGKCGLTGWVLLSIVLLKINKKHPKRKINLKYKTMKKIILIVLAVIAVSCNNDFVENESLDNLQIEQRVNDPYLKLNSLARSPEEVIRNAIL